MLTFQITDLEGEVKATLWRRKSGEVSRPINDSCTAKVTLSVYRPEIEHVIALERCLKVSYFDHLVFWGPLLTPIYRLAGPSESVVELNAHDDSLAWKKNFLRYGDIAVDVGYPLDGEGLTYLAEAALPSPPQLARGVKHPGFVWGVDTSTPAGAYPEGGVKPGQTAGLWTRATRGAEIFSTMQSLAALPQGLGPDWNLRPIDADHPGAEAEWQPGLRSEFNRYFRRGVDRRELAWQKGFGIENVAEATWQPDGDKVQNYAVVVFPGGEDNAADRRKRRLAHLEAEWQRVGIYESWNASSQQDYNPDVLQERADAIVDAYGIPPDYVSITAKTSSPHRYIDHFTEGDDVRIGLRQGFVRESIDGRVTTVTLSDEGHGKATSIGLDVVPKVDADKSSGDEGG